VLCLRAGWVAVWIAASSIALASGLDAQRIVAQKSLELLPPAPASLLRDHLDELLERAVEPDAVWAADPELRERLAWHVVAMDIEATEQAFDARMAAARGFPMDQAAAKRLYSRLDVPTGRGVLPWVIEDHFNQLVAAFREGSEADVVRVAGYAAHFATDAAFPFHASVDSDGKLSGNLHLGRVPPGHPHFAHAGVADRFEGELIRRNRARYAEAVKLSIGDYEPVDEPLGRARAVLLGALSVLDEVATADKEIIQTMQIGDGDALLDRADEYYQLLDQRAGRVCVERLRCGAILTAGLIGGAWTAAGKPLLEDLRQRTIHGVAVAAGGAPDGAKAPAVSAGSVVGSTQSKVYHRPDCRWAAQIAPENFVTFASEEEAKAAGRRPCRFCFPPEGKP